MTTYGILIAGWHCPSCRAFNGEERARLDLCRVCDTERPAGLASESANLVAAVQRVIDACRKETGT